MTLGLPTSLFTTGQTTIATTGTAVQLDTNAGYQNGVIVKAYKNNAADIYVGVSTVNNTGGGTGNGFILSPGDSVSISLTNDATVYINGTARDFVSYLGN